MRVCITGGAGFIGSSMVDRLLSDGHTVTAYDNFSTGQQRFLNQAQPIDRFTLAVGDLLDVKALTAAIDGADLVIHFAANADVRFGTDHPDRDIQQNTYGTFNVLEAMRATGVKRIAFSSTGSVYGEAKVFPTPEDAPFPIQTSLYAASKLAGEGLISAYCEGFGFTGYIFRFVSILGERYTHGHVFDFYRKLRDDPTVLPILGNGKQRKSYLYIQDCLDAMLTVFEKSTERVNLYNLGTNEYCEVNNSAGWIAEAMGLSPQFQYSGGERGWIGDSPFIFLDTRKVRALGWEPKLSIREGVIRTLEWLQANEWVYESRQS